MLFGSPQFSHLVSKADPSIVARRWPWGSQKADNKELFYVPFQMYICFKLYYIGCLIHMSPTFVYGHLGVPLPTSQWSQWRYCVSLCLCQQLVCLSASVRLIIRLKSDCDKVNHVVFMISLTNLFRLQQMIWCYVTIFVVCQSVSFYLYLWKICISHYSGVMSHMLHFRWGTWKYNCCGELVKNKIQWGT